jgi:uncharacterized protein YacL
MRLLAALKDKALKDNNNISTLNNLYLERAMATFYEVMKWFFFFATIVIGAIFLRWEIIFGAESYIKIKSMIIPWYLVFCGIIIGYIIAHMISSDGETSQKTYVTSFIIGIIIGIVLALSYMLI